MNVISLSTFRNVPEFAKGLVRDLRVRWTLEELGRDYRTAPITFDERVGPEYRQLNPFGQVPALRQDGETLFESGAILFALADGTPLIRPGVDGRNATLSWMFAALSTVEPDVALLFTNDLIRTEKDWARQSRDEVEAAVERRLCDLDRHLNGREHLLESFTIADVLMVTVLRFLKHTDMLAGHPEVNTYVRRCTARPGFQRALAAQLDDFEPMAA